MQWFGTIKAILNTWKKVVKNEVVDLQGEMPLACDTKIHESLTSICKISVKTVYDLLLVTDLEETCLTKHYPKYA